MRRAVAGFMIFASAACVAVAADPPTYRPQSATPVPVIRTTPAGCTGFNYMLAMARIGREGVGTPAFTTETSTLSVHYLGAQTCRGWAGNTRGENWVSCANEGADPAAATQLLARHAAAIKACFPEWKAQVKESWAGFTRPDGKAGIALSLAGSKLDTTVRYHGAAPSTATAKDTASTCAPVFQAIRMARSSREGTALPAFADDITPMSKGYLGAPRCGSWLSEGGGVVNCPAFGDDDAWAQRFWNERVATLEACLRTWRRQDVTSTFSGRVDHATFTSLDGLVSVSVAKHDPAYGPMVETTARAQPCGPITEMMGRARVGRLHVKEPVPTEQPTPLEMRYFAAEACSVRKNAGGGYAVACAFQDVDHDTSKRAAANAIKAAEACIPDWKRTTLSDGVSFDKGDGLSFVVEARSGRPAAMMMTFSPNAK